MATTTTPRRRRRTTTASASTPTRSFDEFQAKARTTPGANCPRCGENKKAGNVGVRLNRTEGGRYKQVTSRHVALCETCCVEVYEEMVGKLEDAAAGNGN